jgi:hypothetical protein
MKQKIRIAGQAAVLTAVISTTAHAADIGKTNWLDNTISPVANPIYFEDPRVTSEVRPVYMYHWLPDTFDFRGGSVPLGGQVQVMALQLRYALTDRLGLIASKDGYIQFQPQHTLGHAYGWADLAAGLKYVLVDDQDNQAIVTPGFTLTIPTGSTALTGSTPRQTPASSSRTILRSRRRNCITACSSTITPASISSPSVY